MKKIILSGKYGNGQYAIVNDEMSDLVLGYKNWCCTRSGYVYTQVKRKNVYLHRLVIGAKRGEEVDHINRDKLDNRKSNLRLVKHFQNSSNKGLQKNNKSGYIGVNWLKKQKKWRAEIQVCGKSIHLGLFDDARKAAFVRDGAAQIYFGEYGSYNFEKEETYSDES